MLYLTGQCAPLFGPPRVPSSVMPERFLPQEGVSGVVPLKVRFSSHPALVVNAAGVAKRPAKRTYFGDGIVLKMLRLLWLQLLRRLRGPSECESPRSSQD